MYIYIYIYICIYIYIYIYIYIELTRAAAGDYKTTVKAKGHEKALV